MAGLESKMRKLAETLTLVKDSDFVIVEVGSRAYDHFLALEYHIQGEPVEEGKPKRKGRAKPTPTQA